MAYLRRVGVRGDLVLCEAAIRDEGVSHHYLPPARLARAPAPMSAALGAAMTEAGLTFRTGISWTIDTPYRRSGARGSATRPCKQAWCGCTTPRWRPWTARQAGHEE